MQDITELGVANGVKNGKARSDRKLAIMVGKLDKLEKSFDDLLKLADNDDDAVVMCTPSPSLARCRYPQAKLMYVFPIQNMCVLTLGSMLMMIYAERFSLHSRMIVPQVGARARLIA